MVDVLLRQVYVGRHRESHFSLPMERMRSTYPVPPSRRKPTPVPNGTKKDDTPTAVR